MTELFAPDPTERANRALADLRMGVPVVLRAPAGCALVLAVETLGSARLVGARALASDHGGPAPDLTVTARRAQTLNARVYDGDIDGDIARIPLPPDADLRWVQAVSDPKDDLRLPMKGPLRTRRDGDAALHRLSIGLVKAAQLLPATLVLPLAAPGRIAEENGLVVLDADAAVALLREPHSLQETVAAALPTGAASRGRLRVFRPEWGGVEHYAYEIGNPDREAPVLARLHSACFTGDVLGSLKCDCGAQLRAALAQMGAEGAGVLLYLNQEGRGIGLANKMRAYSLQDQGFDTVDANHRLGFEDDERDFRIGAALLQRMGFGSVRLLTNNPRKIAMMESAGLRVVERVPLAVGRTDENAAYLATKVAKSGHLI